MALLWHSFRLRRKRAGHETKQQVARPILSNPPGSCQFSGIVGKAAFTNLFQMARGGADTFTRFRYFFAPEPPSSGAGFFAWLDPCGSLRRAKSPASQAGTSAGHTGLPRFSRPMGARPRHRPCRYLLIWACPSVAMRLLGRIEAHCMSFFCSA